MPIETAIRLNDHFSLEKLLKGINIPEYRNEEGQSLLHLSAYYGNMCLTKYFIQAGCDINSKDKRNKSPLIVATKDVYCFPASGWPSIVRLLLEAGADMNVKNIFQQDLFFKCFIEDEYVDDDLDTAEVYLDYGANVHTKNKIHNTPLDQAAFYGKLESVEFLLNHGADPNNKNIYNETTLHMATAPVPMTDFMNFERYGRGVQYEILKCLLQLGADPNSSGNQGNTPFHNILRSGNEESVRLFLDHGADLQKRDHKGQSAIHFAAMNESVGVLKLLVNMGFNVEDKTKVGASAIHKAVEHCLMDNVKFLQGKGLDINCTDRFLCTPLYNLISTFRNNTGFSNFDRERFVDFLIDSGADINVECSNGSSIVLIPFDGPLNESVQKFILRFLAKVKFFGKEVHELHLEYIQTEYYSYLQNYFNACLGELSEIRDFVIYNANSIFPIFSGNQKVIARYALNDKFVKKFDELNIRAMFPIYGEFIKEMFAVERKKRILKNQAVKVLKNELPQKIQVDLIINKIVDYLSTKDLVMSLRDFGFRLNPVTNDIDVPYKIMQLRDSI